MAFSSDKMRQAAGAGGGYTINNSCRFNDNDSAYLSRTPSSAGNRKTWTWSGWVKKTEYGTSATIFDATSSSNRRTSVTLYNGKFFFYAESAGGGTILNVKTQGLYRDPSAWYHLVLVLDTTQASANDRTKIYVNGEAVPLTYTSQPTQNQEYSISHVGEHNIGRIPASAGNEQLDGYLAEVNFIDGQALTPSSFGETDATYGHWIPKKYAGTYGTNGFYLDFANKGTKIALTANGSVAHSTTQSKIGSTSIDFNGNRTLTGTLPHRALTGDFTIEYWTYLSSLQNYDTFLSTTRSGTGFNVGTDANGKAACYLDGSGRILETASNTYSTGTWQHTAYVRQNGTLKVYIDGTEGDSVSNSTEFTQSALSIGALDNASEYFDGYMDELRISRVARYTSGFTPSTTAFTDDSDTILLIHSDTTNGSTTFTDSSGVEGGLGNDQSGQNNDWTSNNLAATDQMLDTPTNNFCTMNPDTHSLHGGNEFMEGNLRVRGWGNGGPWCLSTQGFNSGKWYFEFLSQYNYVDGMNWEPGIIWTEANYMAKSASNDEVFGVYAYTGNKDNNSGWPGTSHYGSSFSKGDVIQIAVDKDSGKIWFGKNGSWYNNGSTDSSANPGTGTNPAYTSTDLANSLRSYIPFQGYYDAYSSTRTYTVANFGQDSSFAGNKTAQGNQDSNDIGDFYYTPPSGYLALCTANLDDPAAGLWSGGKNVNFNTVLYTGNGSTQSITGVGFQPDFTWIKDRGITYGHNIYDAIRGANKVLFANYTAAEATDTNDLMSFDSDGFSLGAEAGLNNNGSSLVAWNWKANGSGSSNDDGDITSTVSANTTAGFSIVSYTGSTSESVGHGLDQAPEMIIVKDRDVSSNWAVYHQDVQDNTANGFLEINTTSAIQSGSNPRFLSGTASTSQPTSTVFYVNNYSGSSTNTSSNDYIAYCFHSVDGYSKVGSYTGNGSSDGTFCYTGFAPKYVMTKRTDSTSDWRLWDTARNDYNVSNAHLLPNLSNAENTSIGIDFLSNGFKPRTSDTEYNASGGTYIFIAFAEVPFKYSTGV